MRPIIILWTKMMMKLKRMRKKMILNAVMTNRRATDIIAIRTFLSDLESLSSILSIYRDKSMRSKCR